MVGTSLVFSTLHLCFVHFDPVTSWFQRDARLGRIGWSNSRGTRSFDVGKLPEGKARRGGFKTRASTRKIRRVTQEGWWVVGGGGAASKGSCYAGREQDKERISLLGRLITPSFPPQVRPLFTMHRRYWHLPCFPYSFRPLPLPASPTPLAIAFTLLPLSLSVPPASFPRSRPRCQLALSKERPVARVRAPTSSHGAMYRVIRGDTPKTDVHLGA